MFCSHDPLWCTNWEYFWEKNQCVITVTYPAASPCVSSWQQLISPVPGIALSPHWWEMNCVITVTYSTASLCVSSWQPSPWASVHWLVQCTLECHWLTQCTLRYHWATKQILAGYIGTPLEKLSWDSPTLECHWRNLVESAPHWDASGETLTFAAYTGTPLEGLWQPTHALTHIV